MLELQAHGGPVVLQLLLARCLEAGAEVDPARNARAGASAPGAPGEFTAARLPQRQARPGAGRSRGRPDRRQHRSRGALGRPLARWRVLARDRRAGASASSNCARWSRRRSTFPRRRSTSSSAPTRAAACAAIAAALDAVLDRARQGALLREGITVVLAGPAQRRQELAAQRAGRRRAGDRHADPRHHARQGRPDDPDRRRAGARGRHRRPARRGQSHDEVERIGIARSWAEIEGADAVVFLHDLTRLGEAGYEGGDAAIAARLRVADSDARAACLQQERCRRRASAGATAVCASRHAPATAWTSLRRALLELAGWHAQPEGVFIARARHVQALQRRARISIGPGIGRTRATPRSNCWPRSCAWRTMRWARSPAPSAPTTCSARSSAAFASASNAAGNRQPVTPRPTQRGATSREVPPQPDGCLARADFR